MWDFIASQRFLIVEGRSGSKGKGGFQVRIQEYVGPHFITGTYAVFSYCSCTLLGKPVNRAALIKLLQYVLPLLTSLLLLYLYEACNLYVG